jgi:hypothetical protein
MLFNETRSELIQAKDLLVTDFFNRKISLNIFNLLRSIK